ncbi:MAG: hypothetical protein IVW51_04600 [Thermaceae bacterium]|nr:hypothetical protein [Thermaceae bacterium]
MSNREVLRLYVNGEDIMNRHSNRWIVDFVQMPMEQAQQYREPFKYVEKHVKPVRDKNNERATRENWWRHKGTVPAMRKALEPLSRFIATVKVAKHRMFVWLDPIALPSDRSIVISMDDHLHFGLLNSSPHVIGLWRQVERLRIDRSILRQLVLKPFPSRACWMRSKPKSNRRRGIWTRCAAF